MKLVLLVGTVAVAGTLLATSGPGERVLVALGIAPESPHYLGYIECETTLVASPIAGRLVARPAARGHRVTKGDRLFIVETTQAEAEVERAKASLAEFQARHQDLLTGKRRDELDVIRARRHEMQASLALAEDELKRQSDLLQHKVISRQAYDEAVARVAELRARVASEAARERAGRLAAREPEIEAAMAIVEQSKATLARAQNRLANLMPVATEDALVENTFYNVGESVTAGSAVVSLLAQHRVKVRFFVHEEDLAKAAPGGQIRFSCDGCPPGLAATITYIAPRAEYTPPVIYSQSARAKLVFLIEARPHPTQAPLPPGLPVTVESLPDIKS